MLNQDFKEFIQSLNDNQVRYLVIGGYAVALHGYPRYTKDIDIWIEIEIAGVLVNFIDLENLRVNKRASGRLQDLADLENLEASPQDE
ncbi:hypothetical protein [Coleofasciculus sp. E1-EBD-02]|uniref:hypothetical protein n=1 Tax=Coleofasciculus sp. E1-EBD-02 TaxID=3068481 RepID=UPI0032F63A3A